MSGITSGSRDVAAIKASHPIAGVVAGYGIALRPAGKALVGRCPFHEDTGRPNLHVYPTTGSYFCFRCGKGGDAIDFVMRRERLGFLAACDRLQGIPLHPIPSEQRPEPPDWERLSAGQQRALDAALRAYACALWRTPRALLYLSERGIGRAAIEAGLVGYADGQSLAGLPPGDRDELEGLGLLRRDRRGGPVERFAGRIVVAERRGVHAIWCIGRAWAAPGPRFLALPGERPLLGLERIEGKAEVFVVEGLFDWLTAIGWGLPACSLCGTHGSERQLRALDGAERIYGVFDGDAAGREAAARLAHRFGARWRALALPEGCDLNDLGRRRDGRRQFFALLRTAQAAYGHHAWRPGGPYPEE